MYYDYNNNIEKGQDMTNTKEEMLHYALRELSDNLIMWGIDNSLGIRENMTSIKIEATGATNLVALVNALNNEISRQDAVIKELEKGCQLA